MGIRFDCVSKAFGGKDVLREFSLELPDSGTVAVVGPSGCGKTTLLRILAGLEKPDGGVVAFGSGAEPKEKDAALPHDGRRPQAGQNGTEAKLPSKAAWPGRLSMVFQEDRLLDGVSAYGNVLAVLDPKSGQVALEWLGRMGLRDDCGLLPPEMSGGMRRRLAIARAMAFGGDLVLLDEPFAGLDDATREQIYPWIFDGASEDRLTILVTHDIDEARRLADSVIVLDGPPLAVATQ